MTLPPAKIGYKGQPYRIMADKQQADGSWVRIRVGWSSNGVIDGLKDVPGWRNVTIETVVDKGVEGTEADGYKDQPLDA